MELNKNIVYSRESFFWIPTYYDNENDLYFCVPKNKKFISKFYEKEYRNEFSSKKNRKWKLVNLVFDIFNINKTMYISDFKIINTFKKIKNKSILEIGVWFWKNIIHLFRKWLDIKWVELDKNNVKYINSKLNKDVVTEWNYEEISVEWKFDVIYIRHVLEHFLDINYVVNKLSENLNRNWIVYINVPNASNKKILESSIKDHPYIYHFTKRSLKWIFEEMWYNSLHINTYNFKTKNSILNTIKSIIGMWNLKRDNANNSEFLIWVFSKNNIV